MTLAGTSTTFRVPREPAWRRPLPRPRDIASSAIPLSSSASARAASQTRRPPRKRRKRGHARSPRRGAREGNDIAKQIALLVHRPGSQGRLPDALSITCLLYTSDAADDLLCVDLGGRRIIKK